MSNVLYVPHLALNLLSVSKICKSGYQVTFDNESCKVVSPKQQEVAVEQESDGLYRLKMVKNPSAATTVQGDRSSCW